MTRTELVKLLVALPAYEEMTALLPEDREFVSEMREIVYGDRRLLTVAEEERLVRLTHQWDEA